MSRVNKIGGLSAVDRLRKGVMHENILDVELMNCQFLERAKLRTVWMVVGLMTELKVSLKSMPGR